MTTTPKIYNHKKKGQRSKWRKQKLKKQQQKYNSKNQLNTTTTVTKEKSTTIYYSIYRGWSVNFTACFYHPVYALIWCRWMLWKDMVLHYWRSKNVNPKWHSCVGCCDIITDDIEIVIKNKGIWGEVTKRIFNNIEVMKYNGDVILNHKLLMCMPNCYQQCLKLFKEHACYQQSAGSIFKNHHGTDLIFIAKQFDDRDWKLVNCCDIMVSINFPKNGFLDIAKTARDKLKCKKNDRSGGKNVNIIIIVFINLLLIIINIISYS